MAATLESPSIAVERTLEILEAVAHRSGGMSNADISRKLRIPKSSASYILRTLEHRGYLRRDPETGRYRLGVKVLSLSRGALTGLDVREAAQPIMRHLVEHNHLTAHLAILDGDEAVYVEKVDAPGFIKMDTWVGRRMEIHSTSVGKALAAYLDPEKIGAILKSRGMKKLTQRTITSPARFMKELEKVREQGYAVDDEENSSEVRCVAAPIFGVGGQIEASLGMTGTIHQISLEMLPKLAAAVKDATLRISHQLGYDARLRRSHVAGL
ncbi:MAG: IclR family transcriptional regulator [Acidobacteriia bacterium]|nr:IclR family transcriptional regulator [Terriglobia bacterium]